MKVRILHGGRVVELPVDGLMVLDDLGQALVVAGRMSDGLDAFAHIADTDFDRVAESLGFDHRTVLRPEFQNLRVDESGRLVGG